MTGFVYYKTSRRLRSYLVESPREMWDKIHLILNKGYTVTEVNIYDNGTASDYTLHFNLQGEPILKKFR